MRSSHNKIVELRQEISQEKVKNKELAVKKIGKLNTKDSFSVLIYILEQIERINSDDALAKMIQILKEIQDTQEGGLTKLMTKVASLTPEEVREELGGFVNYAGKVSVFDSTVQLWQEVAVWLKGICERIKANFQEKKSNGTVLGFLNNLKEKAKDKAKEQVLNHLNITKEEIAQYYDNAAKAIDGQIALHEGKLPKNNRPYGLVETTFNTSENITKGVKPVRAESKLAMRK